MQLNVARLANLVRSLFVVRAQNPLPEVAEEIQPVIVLENDRAEWAFLAGERLAYGRGGAVAGGVGQKGYVLLFNPLRSNVLAVIENVRHFAAANGGVSGEARFLTENVAFPALGAAGTRGFRDRRVPGDPTCTIRQGTATAAALAAAGTLASFVPSQVSNAAQHAGQQELVVVLAPGDGMILHDAGENENWNAGFDWRERAFEAPERTERV